jgi:sugar phosphate isomerase/epimerase
MKYAFCNEMFGKTPAKESFAVARDLGYTGVEIAPFTLRPERKPFDVRNVSAHEIAAIRLAADRAGLEIVGLHWLLANTEGLQLTSVDPAVQQATTDYLLALAETCAALGGSILVFGSPRQRMIPPNSTSDAAEAAAVSVLQAAMPGLDALGVTLALEPLGSDETDFLNTAAQADALSVRIGSPRCRLQLDVKAMSTESTSIWQIIAEHQKSLVHFHANDPNLLGPGMGDVDFRPILSALRRVKYDGWISVEVFRYEPSAEEIARQSIEYLKRIEAQLS